MATTRIKNNQIDDATIVASSKVAPNSVTSELLADNLTYGSNLTVTGDLTVNSAVAMGDITFDAASTIDLGGNRITNMLDGTASQDAVTKNQLDAAQAGLLVKDGCRVATNGVLPAVTASGGPGVGKILTATSVGILTVDDIATVLGDRIIVKDQVAGADNGIYKVTTEGTVGVAFILTRATDYDGNPVGEVKAGTFAFVDEGTQNVKSGWTLTEVGLTGGGTPAIAVVDTDVLTFAQFQGLPAYIAGTNLTLDGQTFNVDDAFLKNIGDVMGGNLIPDVTDTRNLGALSLKWANVYATTLQGALLGTASNAALLNNISSASFLRRDQADTHSATITPTANNTIDLGSGALNYANVYATTFNGIATNADKLDAQEGTYYLDYTNFTNTPDAYTQDASVTVAPTATGTDSLAMGENANAADTNGLAIGIDSNAYEGDNIAIGNTSVAGISAGGTFHYGVAIGAFTEADGTLSTALGYAATSNGDGSVAIGNATAYETDGIAIGGNSVTGQTANANIETRSIAIGRNAKAYETGGISIGYLAATGINTSSADPYGIAIGYNTQATGLNSVSIGQSVVNAVDNQLHIGTSNTNKMVLSATGNLTLPGTVDGRNIATDGSKLDGIESGATADQTAAQLLASLKTVDVNGTAGLNAGTFDGVTSGNFLRSNIADTHSGTITPNVTNTINLGSAALKYANVYATTFQGESTSAQYADLAEMYTADAIIEPGTVVSFGGTEEVTTCLTDADPRMAGVVSTNPAYLMNSELEGVAVALRGRVPCKVSGSIQKGDMLVSNGEGGARAEANPAYGTVIGKALEDSEGYAVIEVVVGS